MGIRDVFDDIGDALIPKEIAPYLGTIGAMIAPVAPILGLTMGQLASMKMNAGKLDPYQAAAVALGYYGGGGPQNRAEGKLLGQRMGRGIEGLNVDPRIGPNNTGAGGKVTLGDRFAGFKEGFTTTGEELYGSDVLQERYNQYLGGVDQTSTAYKEAEKEFVKDTVGKNATPQQVTDAKADFLKETKMGTDLRNRTGITGNIVDATEKVGSIVMPGYDNFGDASLTVGSAMAGGTAKQLIEEAKKDAEKKQAEENAFYINYFRNYERIAGRPYSANPFPNEDMMAKYNELKPAIYSEVEYAANGGRIGYNEGGGIMDVAPGVPPGMELDYRDSGGFIPIGTQERKDDVPAVLAKNEFVLTADSMRGLDKLMGGKGDPRAAAKYMYNMMDNLEAMA